MLELDASPFELSKTGKDRRDLQESLPREITQLNSSNHGKIEFELPVESPRTQEYEEPANSSYSENGLRIQKRPIAELNGKTAPDIFENHYTYQSHHQNSSQRLDSRSMTGSKYARDLKFDYSRISGEQLNKIIYSLIQQKEVVKYIIVEQLANSAQAFEQGGQRLVDTIAKTMRQFQTPRQGRIQIHQIGLEQVTEMFKMLNIFAQTYLKEVDLSRANTLLQVAIQINKHYPHLKQSASLQQMIYSNLSIYHLNIGSKTNSDYDFKRASVYMDGAIISTRRREAEQDPRRGSEREILKSSIEADIDMAINLNNKAVVQLKQGNQALARDYCVQVLSLVEQRVFGFINSGIAKSGLSEEGHQDYTQALFTQLLQVLLICYFNLGMTRDQSLESRPIFEAGMNLAGLYLPGGKNSYLYQKFKKKATRRIYDILEIKNKVCNQRIHICEQLPEILPILETDEGPQDSEVSVQFQKKTIKNSEFKTQAQMQTPQSLNQRRNKKVLKNNLVSNNEVETEKKDIWPQSEVKIEHSQPKNFLSPQESNSKFPIDKSGALDTVLEAQSESLRVTATLQQIDPSKVGPSPQKSTQISQNLAPTIQSLDPVAQQEPLAQKQQSKEAQRIIELELKLQQEMNKNLESRQKDLERQLEEQQRLISEMKEAGLKQHEELKKVIQDSTTQQRNPQSKVGGSTIEAEPAPAVNIDSTRKNLGIVVQNSAAEPAGIPKYQVSSHLELKKVISHQEQRDRVSLPQTFLSSDLNVSEDPPFQKAPEVVKSSVKPKEVLATPSNFRESQRSGFREYNIMKAQSTSTKRNEEVALKKPTFEIKQEIIEQSPEKVPEKIPEKAPEKPKEQDQLQVLIDNSCDEEPAENFQQVEPHIEKSGFALDSIKSSCRGVSVKSGDEDIFEKLAAQDTHREFIRSLENMMHQVKIGEGEEQDANYIARMNSQVQLLQSQQTTGFTWTQFQMQTLEFLRSHYKLFSPTNIWQFNQRLVSEIKDKRIIKCCRLINQPFLEGGTRVTKNFRVLIEVRYDDLADTEDLLDFSNEEDAHEKGIEFNVLHKRISICLKAQLDGPGGQDVKLSDQSISMFELHNMMFSLSGLPSIDPCTTSNRFLSSVPFYHIETFEELCEQVLFPFVHVCKVDDYIEEYCPDFNENPKSLFDQPVTTAFLGEDSTHNCEVSLYSLNQKWFRLSIVPIFDTQSQLLKHLVESPTSMAESADVHPLMPVVQGIYQSTCQFQIDVEIESAAVVDQIFKKVKPHAELNPREFDNCHIFEFLEIEDPAEFYNSHFKPQVDVLEKLVLSEYSDWLNEVVAEIKKDQALNFGNGALEQALLKDLDANRKLTSLIINQKVIYVKLKIGKKLSSGQHQFSMMVGLKKRNPDHDGFKSEDESKTRQADTDIKFVGFLLSEETQGQIIKTSELQIPIVSLAETFGQNQVADLSSSGDNNCNNYVLKQLASLYIENMKMNVDEDGSDSEDLESSLSDSDSVSLGSNSSSNDDSLSESKSSVKSKKEAKIGVYLQDPNIQSMFSKTVVFNPKDIIRDSAQLKLAANLPPMVMSYKIMASVDSERIYGVKMQLFDSENCEVSGIFFLVDQNQWVQSKPGDLTMTGMSVVSGLNKEIASKYNIVQLMAEAGFDYLFDNSVVVEIVKKPDSNTPQIVFRIKQLRFGEQEAIIANSTTSSAAFKLKHTSITSLERHLTPSILNK